jgi:flagellin
MEGIIMPLIINTNVQSMNSQRQLVKSGMEMSTAMERLSSGKRINSAADDAAGLAIASRMTSQIRGLSQAVRNANDGISLIQVAGGALGESTNILQRMRELAIQSSNGIYTDANRTSLNAELNQLKSELTRIAETTSFNGLKVLDGTLGQIDLQIGSEAGETIGLNIGSGFTAEALGASEGGVSSGSFTLAQITNDFNTSTSGNQGNSGTSGTLDPLTAGDLKINGVSVPAALSASDTVSSSDNTSSAISVAQAINSVSSETGVVAEANATVVSFALGGASTATTIAAGDLVINGVDLAGTAVTGNTGLAQYISSFASQTGVTATVDGSNNLVLTAADGRNIQFQTDGDVTGITSLAAAANAFNTTTTGTVTLRSNDAIDIGGNNPGDFGFTAGAVAANTTSALQPTLNNAATMTLSVTATATAGTTTDGDLVLNGVNINYTGGATADAAGTATSVTNLLAAINAVKDTTGVTATSTTAGQIVLTAAAGISINLASDATNTSNGDTINITGGSANLLLDTTATSDTASPTSPFTAMTNGDLTINGYTVNFDGTTATDATEQSAVGGNASAMFNALAINSTEGLKDQVLATAYTEMNLGEVSAGTADNAFSLVVNGLVVDIDGSVLAGDTSGNLVGTLNSAFAGATTNSDAEGLVASINDNGELILSADDGRNIIVSIGATANTANLLGNLNTTTSGSVTSKGTVSLTAKDGFSIGEIGGDRRSLAGIESSGGTVASTDISTQSGAQAAISVFDRAIDTINAATGNLGAANNRLDFTVSNLSAIIENAAASRSSIMDADFAMETAQLSRAQVLQQAASAMLAQANALPSQVLSLLR